MYFDLPISSKVGRVVPKNAFEEHANTKQKRMFTDRIQRIIWTHKLSSETINLRSSDIKEIQVFKIELKEQSHIDKILEIIDKVIPYHIVFWVEFEDQAYISAAAKHPHPTNEDTSIIDWTFTSEWFSTSHIPYHFNLKISLDKVFTDFCIQLTGEDNLAEKSLDSILQIQQETDKLKRKVSKLKAAITKSKQYNEKVSLNIQLKEVEKKLEQL